MINRDQLKREIDTIDDAYLEVLHRIILSLQQPPQTDISKDSISENRSNSNQDEPQSETSLFRKLKQIKISAPADFSENIDDYLTGEKNV
jgi:hypothetical protein